MTDITNKQVVELAVEKKNRLTVVESEKKNTLLQFAFWFTVNEDVTHQLQNANVGVVDIFTFV